MDRRPLHWRPTDVVNMLHRTVQGEVRILGQARQGLLSDDAELAARLSVGMVFQNGALFDSLTVGENVGFLLYEHTRLADRRIRVCHALKLCACFQNGRAHHLV